MTIKSDFKSAATRRSILQAAAGVVSFLGLGISAAYAAKASNPHYAAL